MKLTTWRVVAHEVSGKIASTSLGKMKETIFPETLCADRGQQQLATW